MISSAGSSKKSSERWPLDALAELVQRPANQLPALDGLRAMAVLFVICDHWRFAWSSDYGLPSPSIVKLPMFHWGWTGVDLFFILSGFLIGKQLWSELYATKTISVSRFVLRRGFRIWPLYYVMMIVFAMLSSKHSPQWPDWIMLSNYVPTKYGRSWSLSTEEQFYLLVPTVFMLMGRGVQPRWWPAVVALLLSAIPVARYFTSVELYGQGLASKAVMDAMYSPLHLHGEALLVGLIVSWCHLRRPEWFAPTLARIPSLKVLSALLAVVVISALLRTASREAFAYVALAGIYGSFLAFALADRSRLGAPLRWFLWYPVARLSFGMYLNHLILPEPTTRIVSYVVAIFGETSTVGFVFGLLLTILSSAAFAALTFVLVEQPGLAIRNRYLHSRVKAEALPGAA